MIREQKLVPGEYYHIYSRTIFQNPEFSDYKNAQKLVQNFLLSNSTSSTNAYNYLRNDDNATLEKAIKILREGDRLVDVLCYAVMPDHYHLLLKEIRKNGITDFVRKCNTSIAKYINTKKQRRGPLFESRFKSKHIDSNEYLLHLSLYIHLNPLDFLDGRKWRENKLTDWRSKREKLLKYRWSSLKNFLNLNNESFENSPILSDTEIILGQFTNRGDYESFLRHWSSDYSTEIKNLIID